MDFGKLFQSVEDAVYEVMVWILLLPKTLIRSLFRPRWVIQYVNEEWEKKTEDRFDEYLSPVLLWLMVAVLPLTVSTLVQNGNIKTVHDLVAALHDGLLSQNSVCDDHPIYIYYLDGMDWQSFDQEVHTQTIILYPLLCPGPRAVHLRSVRHSYHLE